MGYNFKLIMTERVHVNATSPTGLDVEFDISLPLVPCSVLKIDANDPSGQTQSLHLDRRHHVWKHRIKVGDDGNIQFLGDKHKLEQGSTLQEEHLEELFDSMNKEKGETADDEEKIEDCGSCFGAGEEGECCDTCDDVKRAYTRKGWHIENPDEIDQCKKEKKNSKEDEGEACKVQGLVALDSGGGSFHLAPGREMDHNLDPSDIGSIFELLLR
jgi:hypothetical protein